MPCRVIVSFLHKKSPTDAYADRTLFQVRAPCSLVIPTASSSHIPTAPRTALTATPPHTCPYVNDIRLIQDMPFKALGVGDRFYRPVYTSSSTLKP
jgi:hypothetical protein